MKGVGEAGVHIVDTYRTVSMKIDDFRASSTRLEPRVDMHRTASMEIHISYTLDATRIVNAAGRVDI